MGDWLSDNAALAVWTILVGIAANTASALLGCFLVLRRLSLLGDAISHAVLPGIALAYLISGQREGWPILLGAMAIGVGTAFLTHSLNWFGRVPEDASMGVVFTSLFALGVILITYGAKYVDLDPSCVLYGTIETVPLDTMPVLTLEVPRAMFMLAPGLLLSVTFVVVFWKELKIVSFDPALAAAMGVYAGLIHYLLMGMVAAVCVASFEAVGSILVVAMLIVPATTARLLSDRLAGMLIWSAAIASLSAVIGYFSALWLNTSVAGMMAISVGGLFALALFVAPRHGFVPRAVRNLQLALRIAAEDIMGRLYRQTEPAASLRTAEIALAPPKTLSERWIDRLALKDLIGSGDVRLAGDRTLELTSAGAERAESIVRAHRLWEAYLGEHAELPLDHLHAGAERMEHFITPGLQARLAAELKDPGLDPHGRAIPTPRDSSDEPI
jgi:manganese/zinc/iron transport system permease protein